MPTNTSFTSQGLQVLSCLIYILGISILSHCLSRRLASEQWSSWTSIKEMSWARICVLLVFIDSWFFVFTSGILVFGIGLESTDVVCGMGIYLCIAFYATSKLLIYSFLAEKVFLVWSPSVSSRRLGSPIYIGCVGMIAAYAIVITLMIVGRVHYLRESDGVCIIGLQRYSSFTLLGYDLFINIVLTMLFLWPIISSNLSNPRLKSVAIRTLVASGVALTTSTINMLVLAMLHGHEKGWICLGSCGADVILNALVIFWVTKTSSGQTHSTTSNNDGPRNTSSSRCPPQIKIQAERSNKYVITSPLPLPQNAVSSFNGSRPSTSVLQTPPSSPGRKSIFTRSFSPPQHLYEDVEMQAPVQKHSIIKSSLFRGDSGEQAVQVTVTREFEMVADDIKIESPDDKK